MTKKDTFFEYFKTVVLTLLIMFFILLVMLFFIQRDVYEQKDREAASDEAVEYYLIGVLIDKNNYLQQLYPKNYKINFRLGILYEIYKDYKNAETNYKLAITKAPYEEYAPQYKLANLYILTNRLDEAQKLMDNISEKPDKKLIGYKADIYYKLGDKDYNSGDYADAIVKYEKSLSYYKVIKSDKIKMVENGIASAYVYLADEYIQNMQIEEAVNALVIANSIVNATILKYKLALLISVSNPMLAYQYFEEVFQKEPAIMSFSEYYNFLQGLADDAAIEGNNSQAELYRIKARKFKDYYENNILSVQDVSIEYADGEMILNRLFKKYNIEVEFRLKNSSDKDLRSLYLEVIFKDKGIIFDKYIQRVVIPEEPLVAGSSSPLIVIKTTKPQSFKNGAEDKQQVTAEIYTSKTLSSYKLLLATIDVNQVRKSKKRHPFDFKFWLRDLKKSLQRLFHSR